MHAWYSFCLCAMFMIKASECLIIRIQHACMVLILLWCHICNQSLWVLDCWNPACMHGAHSASVLCLWSKRVSAWLSEFHMHAWCLLCFCTMFVIKACECSIVRIPCACMVLILLLCHVCNYRKWVLDCRNLAYLWCSFYFCAIYVIKACEWLIIRIPHASMMLILLLCHICDYSKWVLDCQNFGGMYGAHSASVPCLWTQDVSAWLSEFHMHPWCSFCFCAMYVTTGSEYLIVGIPHVSMVLIMLLCPVYDYRK